MAGGGILACPILTTGSYGAVIECQGVKTLSNVGNGWSYEMTPSWQQRERIEDAQEEKLSIKIKWEFYVSGGNK